MTSPAPNYKYDSRNEGCVADLLGQAGLRFVTHEPMPVTTWPWKTKNQGAPRCDFYLIDSKIYVEVKGWMTLLVLAKSAWMSQQGFSYYFFQTDDKSWEPFFDSPVPLANIDRKSDAALLRCGRLQQIEELRHFASTGACGCSELSRNRIQRHILGRIASYREWVGDFP